MLRNYDVIVVGAGPAGSFTSYMLCEQGLQVLIIDKEKFPRYKACGGGLPNKAKALLPFSADKISESEIYNFLFSCKYETLYTRHSDKELMSCFMRSNLDNFLLNEAIKSGVTLVEAEKVRVAERENNKVIVSTNSNRYSCNIIIGADGANSIVARSLNLMQKDVWKAYAIESEIYISDRSLRQYDKTVGLDWGTLVNGYGWIFPKKDHISVGVGGPIVLSKQLDYYFESIIKKFKIEVIETRIKRSHIIPFRRNNGRIFTEYGLLTGDAAGLSDPLTGEGIYYALKSGAIASKVVADYLDKKINDLSLYQEKVNDEIMTELNAALPIQYIFNSAPIYFHKMLRDNDRLWNAFCGILRGELSYTVVKSKLPAHSLLWHPLCLLSKMINRVKIQSSKSQNRK